MQVYIGPPSSDEGDTRGSQSPGEAELPPTGIGSDSSMGNSGTDAWSSSMEAPASPMYEHLTPQQRQKFLNLTLQFDPAKVSLLPEYIRKALLSDDGDDGDSSLSSSSSVQSVHMKHLLDWSAPVRRGQGLWL